MRPHQTLIDWARKTDASCDRTIRDSMSTPDYCTAMSRMVPLLLGTALRVRHAMISGLVYSVSSPEERTSELIAAVIDIAASRENSRSL